MKMSRHIVDSSLLHVEGELEGALLVAEGGVWPGGGAGGRQRPGQVPGAPHHALHTLAQQGARVGTGRAVRTLKHTTSMQKFANKKNKKVLI